MHLNTLINITEYTQTIRERLANSFSPLYCNIKNIDIEMNRYISCDVVNGGN